MAFQYDPQERLTRVTSGTTVCRYAYDGDGTRTKRLDVEGTVHYASDLERNVGAGDGNVVVTRYYYAPLGARRLLVAFRKAGVLYWAGTDHLGGTVRTLDAGFNVVDSSRYVAFGADRDPATALKTDRKFTGQTQDRVSGLYFYKSRYYDQALGRFVQPDSVVPSPKNPQSLNRYSYVLNNPVTYTDPSGHSAESGWDHGSYDSWGEPDYESSGPNDPGYTQGESWETGGGYESGSSGGFSGGGSYESGDVGYTQHEGASGPEQSSAPAPSSGGDMPGHPGSPDSSAASATRESPPSSTTNVPPEVASLGSDLPALYAPSARPGVSEFDVLSAVSTLFAGAMDAVGVAEETSPPGRMMKSVFVVNDVVGVAAEAHFRGRYGILESLEIGLVSGVASYGASRGAGALVAARVPGPWFVKAAAVLLAQVAGGYGGGQAGTLGGRMVVGAPAESMRR